MERQPCSPTLGEEPLELEAAWRWRISLFWDVVPEPSHAPVHSPMLRRILTAPRELSTFIKYHRIGGIVGE